MSLVTVQRSPTPSERTSLDQTSHPDSLYESTSSRETSIGSEFYFYVKGTAVILLHHDRTNVGHASAGGEIEMHLQAMLRVLPPQDSLTMAVRLQWNAEGENNGQQAHYLALVKSSTNLHETCSEHCESVLLGVDCFPGERASIGVVIPIRATTNVRLDGDGGIAVDCDSSVHLFRPISVQAMWTVFQCLHKELKEAQDFRSMPSQCLRAGERLVEYYQRHMTTEDSLRAQWERSSVECTGDLGATSADAERFAVERNEAEHPIESRIYDSLKEVMQTVDLDDVTSKDIRLKVQEIMGVNLDEYKSFISRQMLVIMGQLDKASQIFDYLYLGTEWNACDWEWLEKNGIEYIVNVTNEVENFFPARLKYLKIRVSDEASTELMKYWKQTYQFIKEAKDKGCSVLVHCKKGISRSSSTVIAFAMKEYGWGLEKAMDHVKKKRDCITPNKGFVEQLKIFEGILDAFKKRGRFDIPRCTVDIGTDLSERERKLCRRKVCHGSQNNIDDEDLCKSCCSDKVDEHGNLVKSLVGSFEAIGKTVQPLSITRTLDVPQPRLRLEKVTDWKTRRALAVSVPPACNNTPIRQARAVTISQ